MTERLYYRDSNLFEFDARITECGMHEGRYYTVLDRSAFYPTSGGQMHDTGQMNGIDVIDCIEEADGVVWHLSEKPVGQVGVAVKGVVDRERRRRHRQQHTAQHILSQAFVKLFGYETTSVHLGEEYGAVELGVDAVTTEQVNQAEALSQKIIQENHAVEILFVDGDGLSRFPLRKIPDRRGKIRIVKTGDFDYSACGGTHCSATGEIGIVNVVGVEKMRGHVQVKFLAGTQAIADYSSRFMITNSLSRRLTCHMQDIPDKIERLLDDNKALRKEVIELYGELLPIRADRMADEAGKSASRGVFSREVDLPDNRLAGQLVGMVADRIQCVVLFLVENRLLLAVPDGGNLDARKLATRLAELTGLKGGGSSRLAQFGGAQKDLLSHYEDMVVRVLDED